MLNGHTNSSNQENSRWLSFDVGYYTKQIFKGAAILGVGLFGYGIVNGLTESDIRIEEIGDTGLDSLSLSLQNTIIIQPDLQMEIQPTLVSVPEYSLENIHSQENLYSYYETLAVENNFPETKRAIKNKRQLTNLLECPEIQVNSNTPGNQQTPAIACLVNGGCVATWESDGQDGSGLGIFAQTYNSLGNPSSSEFRINTFTTNNQQTPAVSMRSNGAYMIVWASNTQDGSNLGIYAQSYDNTNTPIGSEFQVNTFTTNDQRLPSIATLSNDNHVITWESTTQDAGTPGIYARLFNSVGSPVTAEFRVNTLSTDEQRAPGQSHLNLQ